MEEIGDEGDLWVLIWGLLGEWMGGHVEDDHGVIILIGTRRFRV